MSLSVAIDASRIRSGGAVAHIKGLLGSVSPLQYGISQVHIWGPRALLAQIKDSSWLTKHSPSALEGSLPRQLTWQRFLLPHEIQKASCRLLFSTDAATVCGSHPLVVMSQDLLSYEPSMRQRYGLSKARVRLEAILHVQNAAFRRADAVIFLSKYAAGLIQNRTGPLGRSVIIPHGIDRDFINAARRGDSIASSQFQETFRFLYVSNTAEYKNHLELMSAICLLRGEGRSVSLSLVGEISGKMGLKVRKRLAEILNGENFISFLGPVPHKDLPKLFQSHDAFVFASSCENLPVTLLEAMAAGLPIACSNRGPMPEVLQDGGLYFDPSNPRSIADSLAKLVLDESARRQSVQRAKELSTNYGWERCAGETWAFLRATADEYYHL